MTKKIHIILFCVIRKWSCLFLLQAYCIFLAKDFYASPVSSKGEVLLHHSDSVVSIYVQETTEIYISKNTVVYGLENISSEVLHTHAIPVKIVKRTSSGKVKKKIGSKNVT